MSSRPSSPFSFCSFLCGACTVSGTACRLPSGWPEGAVRPGPGIRLTRRMAVIHLGATSARRESEMSKRMASAVMMWGPVRQCDGGAGQLRLDREG